MKKRIEPTMVEKAIQTIEGFEKVYKTLQQQTVLRGQSQSTLSNYIRRIADITTTMIYLHIAQCPDTPAHSLCTGIIY
ncbi:hypothetical protein KJ766_03190 [Patescibacteria group bacterium]|nr:hypothetical protein [Patescibacteria group bacterium]